MEQARRTELSVVVPLLNEEEALPSFLEEMARQQGVDLELVVCDGGSTDGTVRVAEQYLRKARFPLRIMQTERGRARQFNAGVASAGSELLLLLHVDSTFPDPLAFRKGIDYLAQTDPSGKTAGKFRLRFRRSQTTGGDFGYYFYESKATLLRRECTHGDQGFLLTRKAFETCGPMDDKFPMLAETRFADRVQETGQWVILPSVIETSARRFEREGLRERQALNAIIMNFAHQGWDAFFHRIPDLYRSHNEAEYRPLPRFVAGVLELLDRLDRKERRHRWDATGAYVRSNAWQVAFALDAYFNRRRGHPPGFGPTPLLDFYDRRLDMWSDHALGRHAAALLVWLWAKSTCLRLKSRQK